MRCRGKAPGRLSLLGDARGAGKESRKPSMCKIGICYFVLYVVFIDLVASQMNYLATNCCFLDVHFTTVACYIRAEVCFVHITIGATTVGTGGD